MKKLSKLLFMGLGILLAFASCSQNKKSITVYTTLEEDLLPPFLENWEETHPDIALELVRDSTGVIASRFAAEKENPQADVIWSVALGQMAPLAEQFSSDYAFKIDEFRDQFYDKQASPRWVGLTGWMNAFTVNTIELKKRNLPLPLSYKDLLDPQYKGLIVMPNPNSSGTGFLTVNAWLQIMGEQEGWAYMDALNKNMQQYVHSGSAPTRLASQGEAVIGIGMGIESLLKETKGAPITTIFPEEGSGWDIDILALVKKEQIKPESEIFMDWALSAPVMELYAESRGIIGKKSVSSKIQGFPENLDTQLIKNDFDWASSHHDEILADWEERYAAEL